MSNPPLNMPGISRIRLVNLPKEEVEAYNARNQEAIAAGLLFPQVQSEWSAEKEAKETKQAVEKLAGELRQNAREERILGINKQEAAKFSLIPDFISVQFTYARDSFHRSRRTGIQLNIIPDLKASYKFDENESVNYLKIRSRLARHYEVKARVQAGLNQLKAAQEAALEIVAPELLDRVKRAFSVASHVKVTPKLEDNKLLFTYQVYPSGPHQSQYTAHVLPAATLDQLHRILAIKEAATQAIQRILSEK